MRFSSCPLLLVSWFPLAAVSCVGTETGNPDVAQVSLRIVSSQPSRIATSGDGASELVVGSAELQVSSLVFYDCSGSEAELEVETASLQDSPEQAIPAGNYCGVRLRAEGDLTDPLSFSAVRGEDSQGIFFGIEEAFVSESSSEIPVSIKADSRLVVALDLADIVPESAVSDLSPANQLDQELILVDSQNNAWLFEEVVSALPSALRVYVDENADGELNEEELAAPLF